MLVLISTLFLLVAYKNNYFTAHFYCSIYNVHKVIFLHNNHSHWLEYSLYKIIFHLLWCNSCSHKTGYMFESECGRTVAPGNSHSQVGWKNKQQIPFSHQVLNFTLGEGLYYILDHFNQLDEQHNNPSEKIITLK